MLFGQLFDLVVKVHYVAERRRDKDAVTEDER